MIFLSRPIPTRTAVETTRTLAVKKVRQARIANEILMHFRAGRKSQNDVSLDESPDSDEDSNSLALLGTISVEDERLHLVEMSDRYQTMYDCLSRNLSPREKHILTLRYGLNGHDPLPQREVAAALGISRSYVSRIEKKALQKLRTAMEAQEGPA